MVISTESRYSDQDTTWMTRYFAQIPGTGYRCFSFPVPSELLWNFTDILLTQYTHSAAPPVRAVPNMSRYVHWGQHYFYRLFGRTKKTAPYIDKQ